MITVYKEERNKLISVLKGDTLPILKEGTWLDISSPTPELLEVLAKRTKIPLTFLMASLDPEESGRVDNEGNNTLIVLDAPFEIQNKKDSKTFFETMPFIIVYNQKIFITIHKEGILLKDLLLSRNKVIEPHKHVRLTLHFLMTLAQQFITCLKRIDRESKEIETKLYSSQKNKELFELMELNKMLVYFSTALNSDKNVIEKLKRSKEYSKYEDDFDLIEDVQVELNQANEMCSIYRDILAGMMDAFASIVSNNLNIVMKTLAILTIVISVPTLVASFYGMNVGIENMPFGENEEAFWIIIAVSAILAIIVAILLFVTDYFKRRR
jgi:Mg2+ and Co2+ transporters